MKAERKGERGREAKLMVLDDPEGVGGRGQVSTNMLKLKMEKINGERKIEERFGRAPKLRQEVGGGKKEREEGISEKKWYWRMVLKNKKAREEEETQIRVCVYENR